MEPFLSYNYEENILTTLLADQTSKQNIIWATSDYQIDAWNFRPQDVITTQIVSQQPPIILPRYCKHQEKQTSRSKKKGEVFTPLWVCTMQNDLVDTEWFQRENAFTVQEKVVFEDKQGKRWTDYVKSKRLEVTCGEAPYLVHRYNIVSGGTIQISERMGMLDRKLRVVSENAKTASEWLQWAKKAFQSIYGYEYQGDNLFLARKNCLDTFVDYYEAWFNEKPSDVHLNEIAEIISWNLWQMDGISYLIPQTNLYARIRNWDTNKEFEYRELLESKSM